MACKSGRIILQITTTLLGKAYFSDGLETLDEPFASILRPILGLLERARVDMRGVDREDELYQRLLNGLRMALSNGSEDGCQL